MKELEEICFNYFGAMEELNKSPFETTGYDTMGCYNCKGYNHKTVCGCYIESDCKYVYEYLKNQK